MYVGTIGKGWRVVAAAAAVGGYLVGKYGPTIKSNLDAAVKDAIKCGLRASDSVSRCTARARERFDAYVAEARAEMAQEPTDADTAAAETA